MYLTIIMLPLLGCIVSGFFGRKVGVTGSRLLSCLCIILTTIFAILGFVEVGLNNNQVSINLFRWLHSESFNMVWNFQFDSLTVSMLIPVLIISSLVHIYSIGYMSIDPHNQRFFSYLSLFTFMMIILVTGDNYLLMFVGWEGVGVCSYLLVSFWFTRIAANQSSLAAFLTNRVGDCFLTIGMFIILWSLGSLDYNIIFSIVPYINENVITLIGICLLIGAMAKSSQVGLHIWLPMAMEGPTPVSALIHAATMVTAGVYLLIRSSPLIEYSSTVLLLCLWLGAITTVFSSLIGLFQQDIKKIIAYSTMSQLGMMVIAIGLSSYNIAIFHLINHAFYKGLLFLGAGAVIHAVVDNQDLRRYGGLISFLPLTYTVIFIASLSLVAFPFMTGFYSKDFILESAYGQYCFSSINVYFIAVIGAIFTTLYSVKVLYLTFLANPNGPVNYYKKAHEGDIFLSLPLAVLALFSIYFGYLTKDIFIGLGSGFFSDNSIFIHPIHEILIDTEFAVANLFKLLPLIFTVLFSVLAVVYPEFIPNTISSFKLSNLGYYVFGFFNQRFLLEYFYNKFIVNTVLRIGGKTTKVLDKGSIEWVGPYGMGVVLTTISKIISNLSKGVVTDYALYILISICFYLSICTFFPVFFDSVHSVIVSCVIILLAIYNFTIYLNDEQGDTFISTELVSSLIFIRQKKKILAFGISTCEFSTTPSFSIDSWPNNDDDDENNDDPDWEEKKHSAEIISIAMGQPVHPRELSRDGETFLTCPRFENFLLQENEREAREQENHRPVQQLKSPSPEGSESPFPQAGHDVNSPAPEGFLSPSAEAAGPYQGPNPVATTATDNWDNYGSLNESEEGSSEFSFSGYTSSDAENIEDRNKRLAKLAENQNVEDEQVEKVQNDSNDPSAEKGKQVEKAQGDLNIQSTNENLEDKGKGVKRERSDSDSEDNDRNKLQKTETESLAPKKESCIDFVLEKQQYDMPDIFESDEVIN